MNPTSEISSRIAEIATSPEMAAAILDIYQQGCRDGVKATETAATVLSNWPDIDLEVFGHPIEYLDLTVKAYNLLKRNGVVTFLQLIQMSESDLMALRNFSEADLKNVETKLADYGLSLKKETRDA